MGDHPPPTLEAMTPAIAAVAPSAELDLDLPDLFVPGRRDSGATEVVIAAKSLVSRSPAGG